MIKQPINEEQSITNIPELSVGELSQAVKRVVEGAFDYVRVRGELSRVTVARSGHLYTNLKDENAVLDAVCWKGTMARLGIKPEEGLEVVCTGRLTTYPGRSNYQLVIESMELAGLGALMKMLEERKARLAAEGLFDESRKQAIPFLPKSIGVVTSPTGAVIRDILHRLADRFPVPVLLWPVNVQGQSAASEVTKAIEGFNAMPDDQRPELLIVGRGGGSFEDLVPFSDEAVVRAASDSKIPIISAVGHEADVTLIDFVADKRAPTPTAAAEMAVPVRTELLNWVLEQKNRMFQSLNGRLDRAKEDVDAHARTFLYPDRMLEVYAQNLDKNSIMFDRAFERILNEADSKLNKLGASLRTPDDGVKRAEMKLGNEMERLHAQQRRIFDDPTNRLDAAGRMLESLSFKKVLERGYAVIRDEQGDLVARAKNMPAKASNVDIEFYDGKKKVMVSS